MPILIRSSLSDRQQKGRQTTDAHTITVSIIFLFAVIIMVNVFNFLLHIIIMFHELYIYCKVIFIIHTIYCNFDTKNYLTILYFLACPRVLEIIEPALIVASS